MGDKKGDFSRDPKTRLADSVSSHYVAVRLQQGVPLLDADWNEMDGLRKHETEQIGAWFIGSGVPVGSNGFFIYEVSQDNDFGIRRGSCLVNGRLTDNDADVSYITQPNSGNPYLDDPLPPLSTPPSDKEFIVYLDVWEREVDAGEDAELVDNNIGIETAVRLKREWAVRVVQGNDSTNLPVAPEGHLFYPLASIKRKATDDRITFDMITDLRRLHLTLAGSTKAPLALYGPMGTVRYSLENFGHMLDITAKAYFNLLGSDLFMTGNFVSATALETTTISAVFNEVMHTARAASIQAKIGNLNNEDGIKVLEILYYAQDHFVAIIEGLVAGDSGKVTTSNLLEDLRVLLNGGPGGSPPGLKYAVLTKKDLSAGIDAQQEINREIGNRTRILPHGHLVVRFVAGPPPGTVISAGHTYRYEFQIEFEPIASGPPQEETFDVRPAMNPLGWNPTSVGTVTLHTGETVAVQVDIAIPLDTTLSGATLELNVRSQSNPTEMNVTNTEVVLNIEGGGPIPNPLAIDLLSPSMNVETDVLDVGRGGPIGLPGNGKNLRFKFNYRETVSSPEAFTVHFVSNPAGTFEDIADMPLQLGSTAGQEDESLFVFQATSSSVNGTAGTLTVRMEKDSDSSVSTELTIKLNVQK